VVAGSIVRQLVGAEVVSRLRCVFAVQDVGTDVFLVSGGDNSGSRFCQPHRVEPRDVAECREVPADDAELRVDVVAALGRAGELVLRVLPDALSLGSGLSHQCLCVRRRLLELLCRLRRCCLLCLLGVVQEVVRMPSGVLQEAVSLVFGVVQQAVRELSGVLQNLGGLVVSGCVSPLRSRQRLDGSRERSRQRYGLRCSAELMNGAAIRLWLGEENDNAAGGSLKDRPAALACPRTQAFRTQFMVGTEWFGSDSWSSAFLSVSLPVLSLVGFLFVRVRSAPPGTSVAGSCFWAAPTVVLG